MVFHVTLRNQRSEAYAMPQPHFDVFVFDDRGNVLWNFLYGAGVFGDEVIIPPGEQYEIDLAWHQNTNESGLIQPGRYRVLAVFFDLPPALVTETQRIVIRAD